MPVKFNDANQAADFLKQVAAQSYGSGRFEGLDGGAGSIGMIGGKPVKFNTHWTERLGKATPEMIKSSNELRMALRNAVSKLTEKNSDLYSDSLRRIYTKLGMDEEGQRFLDPKNTSLLSRKVAADIVSEIDNMLTEGEDPFKSFAGVKDRATSSKGVDTHFAVRKEAVIQERTEHIVNTMTDDIMKRIASTSSPDVKRNYELAFGTTKEEVSKTIADHLRAEGSILGKLVEPKNVSQKAKSLIVKHMPTVVRSAFSQAIMEDNLGKGNEASGMAKDFLRSLDGKGGNIAEITTLGGKKVDVNTKVDMSTDATKDKLEKKFGPGLIGNSKALDYKALSGESIYKNKHFGWLNEFTKLFPDEGVRHKGVMFYLTSNLGISGPLSFLQAGDAGIEGLDLGFGTQAELDASEDGKLGSVGIGTDRKNAKMDISLDKEGKEVVMTQSVPVGLQSFSGNIGGLTMGVATVTTTIRVPLAMNEDLKVGEMPRGVKIETTVIDSI